MKIKNFRGFMKEHNLKDNTMNERGIQKIHNPPIYPRVSKIYSDKGFVNIDDGRMGGTHWTYFLIKRNKSYYFDWFAGAPEKFLLNHIPKPITYHNYNIQEINSKLSGSYRLYFFLFNSKNELL